MNTRAARTNYSWYKYLLKRENLVVFVILFVCFALRICNFSSASIWQDEGYSLMLAHQKPADIIKISVHDINPPLYGLAIHYWAKFFGYSEAAIRFLSVIFSFFTGLVLYRTGRKFFNYLTAITAVLFFSFSNLQIYYAEEARGYAMVCFFCSLSIYFFLDFVKYKKRKALILLTIVNALVLYTHYVAGILFIGEAIAIVFAFYNRFKFISKFILSQIISGVIFIPWFLKAFSKLGGFTVNWLPELSKELIYQFFLNVFNHKYILFVIAAWLLISLIFVLKFGTRKKQKLYFILLLLSTMPLLVICLANLYYTKIFYDRYVLFITIPMFIFLGYIFSSVKIHLAFKTILMSSYLYFAITSVQVTAFRNEAWKEACSVGDAFKTERTSVILQPSYSIYPYEYYALRWTYINDYKNLEKDLSKKNVFPVFDTSGVVTVMDKLKDRVIFYSSHYWFNDNKGVENLLLRDYKQIFFREYYGVRVYVFEKKN